MTMLTGVISWPSKGIARGQQGDNMANEAFPQNRASYSILQLAQYLCQLQR